MSETRKLNTGSAQRTIYHAGDVPRSINTQRSVSGTSAAAGTGSVLSQEQYEAARRRAQEAAMQATRARRTQEVPRVRQEDIQRQAAEAKARAEAQARARAQEEARLAAQPDPPVQARPAEELTMAQRQAVALRQKAERDAAQRQSAATQGRTIRRAPSGTSAQVQHLDLKQAQGKKPMYDVNADAEFEARAAKQKAEAQAATSQEASAVAQAPQARSASGGRSSSGHGKSSSRSNGSGRSGSASGSGGKPPRRNGGSGSTGGKGGKRKKKKKGGCLKVFLITFLIIVLIFAGALAIIKSALAPAGPSGANLSINQLINTPKEYEGKEMNILLVGIDRSTENGQAGDSQTNDGMTDMIMWLHFNNETGEVKMLQIPRNIIVTDDTSFAGNYQINSIAKTQGSDGYNNMNALMEEVSREFQISIDGYLSIRLEKLVELVDILGGIQCYIPQDMEYKGSYLQQGYRWLDGASAEFLLRNRHSYANSDLGRLNTQRYFYAAMFAKLRSMTVWDIAKNLPFYLSMVETNMSISDLVSVAVSLMKVSSDKIMLAQIPVYMGDIRMGPNDVVVVARQEAADLLNTYYRENTGPVDASQLQVRDDIVSFSPRGASDPNVQFMAGINQEVADAAQNSDTQMSDEYTYDIPTPAPEPTDAVEPSPAA